MQSNRYVILIAGILFAAMTACAKTLNPEKPLQQQFVAKAKYKITQRIDLKGGEIIVPAGSKLVFKGGCLTNGTVRMSNAKLLGDVRLYTRVSGSVVNKELQTSWFLSGTDLDSLYTDSVFYLKGYQTIRFAKKDYTLSVRKFAYGLCLEDVTIDGNGCSVTAKNGGTTLESLFVLKNATDVTLRNFRFDGGSFSNNAEGARHNVFLSVCRNICVENIISNNAFTDGLYIRDCNGITVNNYSASHCGRQGCSITSGKNIRICNSTFADSWRVAPKSGIDIEPSLKNDQIDSINITGCLFTGNSSTGLTIHLKGQEPVMPCNIEVNACTFENNNVNILLCSTEKSGRGLIRIKGCTLLNSKGVGLQSKCYSTDQTPEVKIEDCTIENANLSKGTDVRESASMISVHNVSSSPVKTNYGNIELKNVTLRQEKSIISNIGRMVCLYDQASGTSHLENVVIDGLRIESDFADADSYSSYDIYAPNAKAGSVSIRNYRKKAVLTKSVNKALTPCSEYLLKGESNISLKKQVRPDLIGTIVVRTEGKTTCTDVCSSALRYESGDAYQPSDVWCGSFRIEDGVVYVESGTVVRNKKTIIQK